MATAGYSGTPLLKKLGIKEEMKVLLLNKPVDYYELLEKDISHQLCKKNELPGFIHLFAKNQNGFYKEMQKVLTVAQKNKQVIVWVPWYKKSSGIVTDMTEDVIRNYALQNGLVGIKVCAVSEQWSGLKLVVPVSKR
ncbi:MAG: DUF3052 domain-containing protein [Sphingobacteriales bacterium]|nr:DUF3052 domain-containing protein [Sphingobacteriales bacterium]